MNKLNVLPRGFGAFPALEVLDLTYNNLNENSLPGNFFCLSMLFIVLHVLHCLRKKLATIFLPLTLPNAGQFLPRDAVLLSYVCPSVCYKPALYQKRLNA